MMDFGVGLGAELRFDEVAEHSRIADGLGEGAAKHGLP